MTRTKTHPKLSLDVRGVPLSTTNPVSLARYERAADLTVSYFVDPLAVIDEALAEDPDFVMGHCLKAGMAIMSTEKAARPMLAESIANINRLSSTAHPRERAHAVAASAWLEGDFARSIRLYGDILCDYPRDLLALQVAHIGDFLLGESQMLRDRVAQVLPHYGLDAPGFGYVLGMYAFGLEETGLYGQAEETGRRALELNPRDPWAVHAVAHVFEMASRIDEGIDWLESRKLDWAPDNGFAFHNFWHLALYHIDRGDCDAALRIYDTNIRPAPSKVAYELADASSLLWRLSLRDADVGDRFRLLADDWATIAEAGHYAFNDVHALMAFEGAGRTALSQHTFSAMERCASSKGTNAMMTREVGLPLGRALSAFARGRYDECVELLLPIRTSVHRFGGSNAQRDLVHLTLVESALRAGRGTLARALTTERTARRPESPYARLLERRALRLCEEDRAVA